MCIFCVNFAILIVDVLFPLCRLGRIHFEKTCDAEEKTNNAVDEAVLIFFDNFSLHF